MKAKLKVVEARRQNHEETEPERSERIRREWDAEQAERKRYDITDEQLDAVLGQLIEALDAHFVQSAWNFRTNLRASEGDWSNGPYLDGFVEKLDPYASFLTEKIQAGLMPKYPDDMPSNPDQDFHTLLYARQECAYVVGVFMGAKLAGASPKTVELLRKYLRL